MNKKESLEEATIKAIIDEDSVFYHYSDNNYEINDIIRKSNTVDSKVLKIYNDMLNMNVDKLIYMLRESNLDYEATYKYCYIVKPLTTFKEVYMDYSPIICEDVINLSLKNKTIKTDEEVLNCIKLFAKAYLGDNEAKESLDIILNHEISNKKEIICEEVKVIDKKENLTETISDKLTESSENEDLENEIFNIINDFDKENDELRCKDCDVYIQNNNIDILYQTEEDIDRKDLTYFSKEIISSIRNILKDYNHNISKINIKMLDRSGRYDEKPLSASYKVDPNKIKTDKSEKNDLDSMIKYVGEIINKSSSFDFDQIEKEFDNADNYETFLSNMEYIDWRSHMYDIEWVYDLKDLGYNSKMKRNKIYNTLWVIYNNNKWNDLKEYCENNL